MFTRKNESGMIGVLAGLLVLAMSVPATADDMFPPVWRGQSGSTLTVYEFSTAGTWVDDPVFGYTYTPDVQNNPYGPASISVWPGSGQSWQNTWGGHQGVWPLSGAMEITIPNNPVGNPYKDIQVQLTWAAQAPLATPRLKETDSGLTFTQVSQTLLGPTGEYPQPGDPSFTPDWYLAVYTLHIEPNPFHETIRISGSIMVDELVIDTVCVPEPATMCLAALGGLVVLARNRLRKTS